MPRQQIKGGAELLNLSGSLTNVATSFTVKVTPSSNWPTGTFPFVITMDRGTASEERMLITTRSGTSFNPVATRGYDGTTATTHSDNATVEHTTNAVMLQEANDHTNDTTRDDHTQYTKKATLTGKGASYYASAASTPAVQSAGADNTVLVYSAAQANGVVAQLLLNANIDPAAAIALTKLATDPLARANHTGTQLSTTVSDFTEAVQDVVGALGAGGSGLTLTYNDGANTYVLDVNVDSSSIEINADTLRVKAGGITQAMHASGTLPTLVQTTTPTGVAGQLWFDSDDLLLYVYNGTASVCLTPMTIAVATSQTTSSTSYTDLATTGPAVTVVTGTKALVTLTGLLSNSANSATFMGYAISGATTLAATDNTALALVPGTGLASSQCSVTYLVTGLTAGSNVFTSKYRVAGGTGTFALRSITVVGVP